MVTAAQKSHDQGTVLPLLSLTAEEDAEVCLLGQCGTEMRCKGLLLEGLRGRYKQVLRDRDSSGALTIWRDTHQHKEGSAASRAQEEAAQDLKGTR